MDDLTELQSRVAAAQERLQQNAEDERRYGLRLNDIVAIVEGSLARQRQDLEKLQGEVTDLQTTLGKMSSERDEAKTALIQAHSALSAAQTRLGQREVHNEQLRRMLLELLAAIEIAQGLGGRRRDAAPGRRHQDPDAGRSGGACRNRGSAFNPPRPSQPRQPNPRRKPWPRSPPPPARRNPHRRPCARRRAAASSPSSPPRRR